MTGGPLYHTKRAGLRVGDQIPVLFGSKLRAGSRLAPREQVVEAVRAAYFAALASRYDCTFAFTEAPPATWLVTEPGAPAESIYQVEPVGSPRLFRADSRWLDGYADEHHDQAYWRWAATGYWSCAPCPWGQVWEIAIEGPLVVVGIVAE